MVKTESICDLREGMAANHFVAIGVSQTCDVLALSADRPVNLPLPLTHSVEYQVHTFKSRVWRSSPRLTSKLSHRFVQPLPRDRWLLVQSQRLEGENNAEVFSSDGALVHSFSAGDGIEDVQATEDGRIWISYFDEGVFGHTELGQAGLVCLDMQGKLVFNYDRDICPQGPPSISDCYALNVVSNQDVWLSYYSDFPLVHLQDGKLKRIFPAPQMPAPKSFAVLADRILAVSAYGGAAAKIPVYLFEPETNALEEVELETPDGKELKPEHTVARGSRLCVLDGKQNEDEFAPSWVYAVDLLDLS